MSNLSLLYLGLVDDAAIFPPGNLPLPEAVEAHHRHRSAWYGPMVGPFLCSASKLTDLAALATRPIGVGVIVDTGTGGISDAVRTVLDEPNLDLCGVEVPLRGEPLTDAARRVCLALDVAQLDIEDRIDLADEGDYLDPEEVPLFVEVPLTGNWRPTLDTIAAAGHKAKLRTGGPTPDAFPPESAVAEFILACLEYDVPFKFTAGLHRAVRHTTPDGLEEHGFLNALLAVADALNGADHATVAATLADRDPALVAARVRKIPIGEAASVRTWLSSYGSCSIEEPLEDLIELGLVSRP